MKSISRTILSPINLEEVFFPGSIFSNPVDKLDLPTDVWVKDDVFHVSMEVPGMKPEEIDVSIADGKLRISGVKTVSENNGDYQERRSGAFVRVIPLSSHSDTSKVSAEYQNGVLNIEIPLVNPVETKIEVKFIEPKTTTTIEKPSKKKKDEEEE